MELGRERLNSVEFQNTNLETPSQELMTKINDSALNETLKQSFANRTLPYLELGTELR